MNKFNLEFILNTLNISEDAVKNSLIEFGENLAVEKIDDSSGRPAAYKICIQTEDPTLIFDACSQIGRIKSIKVK